MADDLNLPLSADMDFGAALTEEEVTAIEAAAESFGVNRRIAITVLARSKAQLMAGFVADPDAGEDLIDSVIELQRHAKNLADISETALARLTIVALAVGGGDHE
ncbi:hypothetical protein CDEN61S_04146 [Castellaniella denitrificans]